MRQRAKEKWLSILVAPISLAMLLTMLPTSLAWAGDDVEGQLRASYLDKVLTLRQFYKGDHLLYQSDGALIGVGTVGSWTVDGQIAVEDITVRDHALKLRARRVFLVFDAKAKPYRDVLNLLEESNAPDREKLEKFFRTKEVEIEIKLPSDKPDLNEAMTAMHAVFLTPGESMAAIVPRFWRDYFEQQEGLPRTVRHSAERFRGLVPGGVSGGVSAPRATYSPEPAFSDEARRAKYKGTMTVSIVADVSGDARDVQIVTPLGLGLDENAVESVGKWKFEPAKKNGTPVAVELMIEVDFHLY